MFGVNATSKVRGVQAGEPREISLSTLNKQKGVLNKSKFVLKIPHTGDINSLDRCG